MNAVLPLLWYYRVVLLGTLVGLLLTGPCSDVLVLVGAAGRENNFTVTAKRACVLL